MGIIIMITMTMRILARMMMIKMIRMIRISMMM